MEHFGTAGIRGDATKSVTPELAMNVGRAVGAYAVERGVDEVVLGRDGRVTGPALSAAAEGGILSAGVAVRRIGQVPTPALAFASLGRCGVMLTASHNPPSDNGIKLFDDGSEFDGDQEAEIERRLEGERGPAGWDAWRQSSREDVLDAYRAAVLAYAEGVGASPEGLPVAVDCGNGMAAIAVPQVLDALGAEVTAVNDSVDGHFPGRHSKPTRETLEPFRAFLADGRYELGLAHDGDADRVVVLDGNGAVIHEDTVLAVLAEHYVVESDVADPVVLTTPNASGRIDERVDAAGGRTGRIRLGYLADGLAAAREAGEDVVFAAEPWKHVHPDFGGWIDGVASAAVIARLVAEAGHLDALTSVVTERPYRKEAVTCPDERKAPAMERVAAELPERFPDADRDLQHGVRLDFPDGSWLLVRPSGTEPLIRLYAESHEVERLLNTGRTVVEDATATV